FTTDREHGSELDFVAAGEILNAHGGKCAVGNGELGASVGANAGGSQSDVFDGSGAVGEAAIVADADDVIGKHGDSAKKIFERLLRGKRDGNTANAEAGEHRRQVEAHDGEYGQEGGDDDERPEQAVSQDHERSGADAACTDGMNAQPLHGEAGDA